MSGEADRRLHFCPRLGLHRTRLCSGPVMHEVITQDLGYVGMCVVAWGVGGDQGSYTSVSMIDIKELPSIFLFCICLGLFLFPSFFPHPFLSSRHLSGWSVSTRVLPRSLKSLLCVLEGAGEQSLCSGCWGISFFSSFLLLPVPFPANSQPPRSRCFSGSITSQVYHSQDY